MHGDEFDNNDGDQAGASSPDAEGLWDYVTRSVKKIEADKIVPGDKNRGLLDQGAEEKKTAEKPVKSKKKQRDDMAQPVAGKPESGAPSREVDRRTLQRVRRGQMDIEARIDLHGMNQKEARQALMTFLLGASDRGLRFVLVITGKGRRGSQRAAADHWMDFSEAPGILKKRVPEWLDEPPLRNIVLQYHNAQPRDGGDGALYVLLRRRRGA